MKWARMNLKSLLIIWISSDRGMSGEDTRQERGGGGLVLMETYLGTHATAQKIYIHQQKFTFAQNINSFYQLLPPPPPKPPPENPPPPPKLPPLLPLLCGEL